MLMDIGGDVIISKYYKSFIGMPKQKYLIINLRPDIMSRVWGLEIPDQKLSGISGIISRNSREFTLKMSCK